MIDKILEWDIALFWLLNGAHTPATDVLFAILTWLGSGWVVTPVLLTIILLRRPPTGVVRAIVVVAIAVSVSGIVNAQIKRIVNRPRPLAWFAERPQDALREDGSRRTVHTVWEHWRARSFPSGHTNTAFAAAGAIIAVYGTACWWALLVAGVVGFTRVYLGIHFPVDVAVGAILGFSLSYIMVKASLPGRHEIGTSHDSR